MFEHVQALKNGKSVMSPSTTTLMELWIRRRRLSPLLSSSLRVSTPSSMRGFVNLLTSASTLTSALMSSLTGRFSVIWKSVGTPSSPSWRLSKPVSLTSMPTLNPRRRLPTMSSRCCPRILTRGQKDAQGSRYPEEGNCRLQPHYLFDEGSDITWTPSADKLSTPAPGMKLKSYQETYFGNDAAVIEMDGTFDNIQELVYVESNLGNANSKFYGEVTQAMLSLADSPGSNNGSGLMQTLAAFAIRELYNKKAASAKLVSNKAAAMAE